MTLQSSGPIKASQIQAEFNGSPPFKLSNYYAGGANVPAGTEGDGGPIPTSGTIKFSDFYGASNLIEAAKTISPATFSNTRGYVNGGFGSLTPNSLLKSVQIETIVSVDGATINVELDGITLPQNFWTQLVITGGPTLLSADAVFTDIGGIKSQWSFTSTFGFPNSSYPLSFFYFP